MIWLHETMCEWPVNTQRLSHRVSAVHQNWHSIASVYFPKNINPCLTSLEGTKKQQEEIGKMGEGLKLTQKQIQEIYGVVGCLCSFEDRKPCFHNMRASGGA